MFLILEFWTIIVGVTMGILRRADKSFERTSLFFFKQYTLP